MKREWTLITAFIAAGLNWLVGFGLHNLSATQAAWINAAIAAVAGVVVALQTRPIAPQAFTYLITVLAGLTGAYGFHLSATAVANVSALVLAGLALITRGQVSPKVDAPHTGVLGKPTAGGVVQPVGDR
jgi:hypothetical protein